MGITRKALLWTSRNQWLGDQFRRRAFAQKAISRFMPGEDVDAAFDAAGDLHRYRIKTVLTQLGEHVTTSAEAEHVTRHYLEVLDRIDRAELPCQISVKPTQLGLDGGIETCSRQLTSLLAHASERGRFVWVDMESSLYAESTLKIFEHARAAHDNVGLCIQAYLHRAAEDLERLLALGAAVRLVKGAYNEPASVAIRRKADVDVNFMALATRLLDAVAAGKCDAPGFATHDMNLVRRIQDLASCRGVSKDAFEIQMLYGIGREHQRQLASDGYIVRVLISYGSAWFPWYMRRLAERPANVWFVVRSVFAR